jgi:hypothetical protein
MQTKLNASPSDDSHDVLVVAPDVALMVPTDEELSRLARSLRHPSDPQAPAAAGFAAGPTVPPVDTTFRPAAVGDVKVGDQQPTTGGKAARALTAALLVAACTGGASIAWQSYGDATEAMIARWTPQRVLALLPLEKPASAAQSAPPAVEATAANADPAQGGAAAESTLAGVASAPVAPSAETAPSLDSMANELANARQQIEQLKVSIEELKASQQQMSREVAKASEVKASEARVSDARVSEVRPSEQTLRPKISAHPSRTAAARTQRPMPPLPPQQAAAYPALPQAPAPYVPRQVEPPPQTAGQQLTDPELTSVPRPPMPLR